MRPRRRLRPLATLLAVLLALAATVPASAHAANPPSLPDVEDEVMCPTCNVPLNVAESPQANDQRAFIRDLIAQGASKDEIKAALKREYGEDVLALPENEGFNAAVYVVPLAVALAALAALAILLPRWRRRTHAAAPATGPAALSPADAARVEEDLRRYAP